MGNGAAEGRIEVMKMDIVWADVKIRKYTKR